MMKIKFLFLTLILVFLSANAKKVTYPQIQNLHGVVYSIKEKIEIEDKKPLREEKPVKISKGTGLKDQALLKLEKDAQISLSLNPHSQLQVFEDSQVELPFIHWQRGVINEIRMRSGKIRYTCEKECDLKITSPIYESVLPVGDYILTYNERIPEMEVLVLSGETLFRGLENETSLTLREGEKASFTGVFLQDGTIAYDILLKGRKLAQGQVSAVKKLSTEDFQGIKKTLETQLKKAKAQKQAAAKAAAKKQGICSKPNGNLNECTWICQKNPKNSKFCNYEKGAQCVRMRCNANGEWADQTILPVNDANCTFLETVAPCDY